MIAEVENRMQTVDLTTLKTRPGEVLDRARNEAVTIERYGKAAAVIISAETYEHFEKLEDAYWVSVIEARKSENGYMSNNESLSAIQKLLTR